MKKYFWVAATFFIITSCKNHNTSSANTNASPAVYVSAPDTVKAKYTAAMVDNKKDLVCGMPVKAGIGDTCHYKNKVYGFCSKECKDAFLKNPEAYLTKAK